MAPSKQQYSYEKDEKCLCFHGALLYEAKILDLEPVDPKDRKSAYRYRVHYKGWKNTWDDWVPEERLRKLNEENKELAESLMAESKRQQREERQAKEANKRHSTAGGQAKRKSTAAGSELGSIRGSEERSSQVPSRGTKRGRDWDIEKEEAFATRPSIRIPIPDHLKGLLVDDWENITKNLQLVALPHAHPVSELLDAYKDYELPKRRPGSPDADILEEVIQGLREYFDKSLGRILLYRFERQQWLEIHERMMMPADDSMNGARGVKEDLDGEASIAGKTPADVYGAEHLCRLFVSLPELVAQTNMDQQAVVRLREEVAKLTNWLAKNASKYFAKEYTNPGQEYAEKARGTR